jgi:hypothetical protein
MILPGAEEHPYLAYQKAALETFCRSIGARWPKIKFWRPKTKSTYFGVCFGSWRCRLNN